MISINMESKPAAERRVARTKTSTCSRRKRQPLFFAKYKSALFVIAATWSFTIFTKDVVRSARLVGNCDAQNECVLHSHVSDVESQKLCHRPDFSVFWNRGHERYLVQCRKGNASEDNEIWIIEEKSKFFGKLYFGRFFKKSALNVVAYS